MEARLGLDFAGEDPERGEVCVATTAGVVWENECADDDITGRGSLGEDAGVVNVDEDDDNGNGGDTYVGADGVP